MCFIAELQRRGRQVKFICRDQAQTEASRGTLQSNTKRGVLWLTQSAAILTQINLKEQYLGFWKWNIHNLYNYVSLVYNQLKLRIVVFS